MKPTELSEVYRQIAVGMEPHGDFLTCFAKAFLRADAENKRVMLSAALAFVEKYQLVPGYNKPARGAAGLEQLLIAMAAGLEAKGVLLVVLMPDDRVELVAGLCEECPDLPKLVQQLADRVKDGDGMPLGNNGKIIQTPT